MEALLIGLVLGLAAGLVPGPFFTLVVGTALERGRRAGLKVAAVPLLTEPPALLVAVFVLTRIPDSGLRWVGVAGGALVLYMAWRMLRDVADDAQSGGGDGDREDEGQHGAHALRVALVGLMSPTPWIFWIVLGGPLTVNRWHEGPLQAVIFVGTFLASFIAALSAAAWGASLGGRRMSTAWHRRSRVGIGSLLVILGAGLVWQSWEGNFAEMVQAPEEIEERVN